MISEGSKVVYVGDDPMVGVGTLGFVLSHAGANSNHVKWMGGIREGSIDLIPVEELISYREGQQVVGSARHLEETLDYQQGLVTVAVRDTYDDLGEDGLITALDEAGHLATLSSYASRAIANLSRDIRQDPALGAVLGQLDDEEADSLIVRVASQLLAQEASD